MIRFIFLLPLKIIGLLFMAIGAILERREKERIAAAREYEKRIAAAQKEEERRARAARIATERAERSARIEYERLEKRKAEEKKKAYAAKTKLWQAKKDYYHYIEQIKELTRLYNELNEQYEKATGDKRIAAYRKLIGINQSIRNAERKKDMAEAIMRGPV